MSPIPISLAPFFQEYSLEDLDLQRSAGTIIERTLRYGNREELHWLFSVYPKQVIVDWVHRWGQDALPEPHLTFWRLILALPENPEMHHSSAPFLLAKQ